MKFHFNKTGIKESEGPFDLEEACKLVAEGKFLLSDNVWNDQTKNWQKVSQEPHLIKAIKSISVAENPREGKKKQAVSKTAKRGVTSKSSLPPKKKTVDQPKETKKNKPVKGQIDSSQNDFNHNYEISKENLSFSIEDFVNWVKVAFKTSFSRLPNKRWPNFLYLGWYLIHVIGLSIASFGILITPMFGGYIALLISVLEGKTTRFRFSDLISGDRFFMNLLKAGLVLNLITPFVVIIPLLFFQGFSDVLDFIVGVIIGLVSAMIFTVEIFVILLIVERKEKFKSALVLGFRFLKAGLIRVVPLVGIFASLSGTIGFFIFGIGYLITMPMFFVVLIFMLRHQISKCIGAPQS
jgi:hypothetical protein